MRPVFGVVKAAVGPNDGTEILAEGQAGGGGGNPLAIERVVVAGVAPAIGGINVNIEQVQSNELAAILDIQIVVEHVSDQLDTLAHQAAQRFP